jgi:MASE1
VYRDLLPPPWNVPTFILPFLLWAAVRFNPAVSSLAILVIALVGLWSVTEGRGPFAALTPVPGKQVLRAQGTLGVISVSVILLAAVVAERKRGERQKAALIEELERALIEIKTLRDLILCSWCKKMRDDQGYWQSLEVYMKDHYDAKITHGICPSCVESQFRDLAISLPTPAARTP